MVQVDIGYTILRDWTGKANWTKRQSLVHEEILEEMGKQRKSEILVENVVSSSEALWSSKYFSNASWWSKARKKKTAETHNETNDFNRPLSSVTQRKEKTRGRGKTVTINVDKEKGIEKLSSNSRVFVGVSDIMTDLQAKRHRVACRSTSRSNVHHPPILLHKSNMEEGNSADLPSDSLLGNVFAKYAYQGASKKVCVCHCPLSESSGWQVNRLRNNAET